MSDAIKAMGDIIAKQERKYNLLIAHLYSACEIDDADVVRIDTCAMSNILENVFIAQGLILKETSDE